MMIALESPPGHPVAERSVPSGSAPLIAPSSEPRHRRTRGETEPVVVAVVLAPAAKGADASLPAPPNPQAMLDELAVVLERHFGDRIRVADRVLGPTAVARVDVGTTVPAGPPRPALEYGRLVIDFARHEVTVDDRPTPLTKSEFDLLAILAKRPGVVLSRREIVVASKGPNYPVDDRSIDVQMFNLRRKLGPLGRNLQTIRSVGYRFNPEGM